MKGENIKKILVLGTGLILLSSSFVLANGHGGGKEMGQGCKGDPVCIQERRAQKQIERNGEDFGKFQKGKMYDNGGKEECDHRKNKGEWGGKAEYQKVINEIKNSPKGELTDWEKDYLSYRLEEEKTARDIYTTLDEKWNRKPFTNIKKSEQAHLDITAALREKYGFETEFLTKNEVGKFENPKFQKLYDELTKKGLKSWEDAIEVGMIVEDMDLADLDESLAKAQNKDLRMVLEKFIEGSSHHMQAFKKQMDKAGLVYKPEYISEERMKVALSVPKHTNENSELIDEKKENGELNVIDIEGKMIQEKKNIEKGFFTRMIEFLFGWIW